MKIVVNCILQVLDTFIERGQPKKIPKQTSRMNQQLKQQRPRKAGVG